MLEMANNYYVFKVILVGDTGVGKSSIIRYFNNGTKITPSTNSNIPTIGIDFIIKHIKRPECNVKLQIWDTSGQERFKSITNAYYRGANTCVFVFSMSERQTFENIPKWYDEYIENNGKGNVILVGSKHDLERGVTPDEIKEVCNRYNFIYTETSSVSGLGINELFDLISTKMIIECDPLNKYYNRGGKTKKEFSKLDKKGIINLSKLNVLKQSCYQGSCNGSTSFRNGFKKGELKTKSDVDNSEKNTNTNDIDKMIVSV